MANNCFMAGKENPQSVQVHGLLQHRYLWSKRVNKMRLRSGRFTTIPTNANFTEIKDVDTSKSDQMQRC